MSAEINQSLPSRQHPPADGKREPVGWMGPSRGKGSPAKWRVIDSRGYWIASGFLRQADALRWIDSFNLVRAGYRLNDHDHRSLLSHWHSIQPVRRTRSLAPTESVNACVHAETEAEGAGGRRR